MKIEIIGPDTETTEAVARVIRERTRPLAERITPGTVTHETVTHFGQEQALILADGAEMARILGGVGGAMLPESLADAELIAEAFNTTHETGRTPRQLADERAELLASLTGMMEWARRVTQANPGPEVSKAAITLNRITP